jgi:hypothetical protein
MFGIEERKKIKVAELLRLRQELAQLTDTQLLMTGFVNSYSGGESGYTSVADAVRQEMIDRGAVDTRKFNL